MQCNSITQASSTDFGPNSDLAHVEVDEFLLLFLLEGVEQRLPLDVGCGVTKPAKKRSFYLAKNHIYSFTNLRMALRAMSTRMTATMAMMTRMTAAQTLPSFSAYSWESRSR